MSTSSIHPHRQLYLREIEEAFELFGTLSKDGFYNVPKLTWWILKYEELYEYSYNHRHVGSCIDGMGCSCSWDSPESRFSELYSGVKEVVDLHQHEQYFKQELAVLENVRHDHPALMQWLKKNETLGSWDFLMFWIEEWYDEEEKTVTPYLFNLRDRNLKFKAEEWQNTIRFCEEFNELYWTSDACPEYGAR